MDPAFHHFDELFGQLGLPSEATDIVHFLTGKKILLNPGNLNASKTPDGSSP